MSKVIFHVPHDGHEFPPELLESVIIPYGDFIKQHNHISDRFVSSLVPSGYDVIKFPVSRLLCDVERFLDAGEIMNKYGMGFCYEKVFDGTKIKNVTPELLEKTLKYYNAHHELLNACVLGGKEPFIIDLHSFEDDLIIPDNVNEFTGRYPDFCIGYDEGFCLDEIIMKAVKIISERGYSVSINYPFKGSIVPNIVLKNPDKYRCQSMMIEVNKTLYLKCGQLTPAGCNSVKNVLDEIAIRLCE